MTERAPPRGPRGLSLRARWTVALLVVSLAPLAALASVTGRAVYAALARTEQQLQVSVVDRVTHAMSGDLDYVSESVHASGRTLLDVDIGTPEARVRLARDAIARTTALLHVGVYAPSGERIDTIYRADDARALPALERLPTELVAAPPREGRWLAPEFTPAGAALRYAEALAPSEAGAPGLVVVGTLDPRWLSTLVEEVSRDRFHHPDRVMVTDEDCRALVRGVGPAGTSLAGRDVFVYRDALRMGDGARTLGITREYLDGEPMVGSLYTFRRMGWLVAVRRPEREAFGTLDRARRLVVVAALLCAAAAAAIGALLAGRTTRPVRALVELTERYARREFTARAGVQTGDELEALGASMERMADDLQASEQEIARRARVESDLARYLPAEVATAVAKGTRALSLGGERRAVAVLFADVASFTSFAESAPPERVVAFLNELFTLLSEVVFRHGGMVDKFIGDCVMAVFGTGSDPRDATADGPDAPVSRCLAAAEDIHRFVEASAPAWKETYGFDVKLGVGVNLGEALVGNLGSETRMEYTVIGDVVNVAARLEGLARGGQTLATGAVVRAAGQAFAYNPLGGHALRGKREMVEIFEVTS